MGHDTWRDSARLELIGRASLAARKRGWEQLGAGGPYTPC